MLKAVQATTQELKAVLESVSNESPTADRLEVMLGDIRVLHARLRWERDAEMRTNSGSSAATLVDLYTSVRDSHVRDLVSRGGWRDEYNRATIQALEALLVRLNRCVGAGIPYAG